MFVRHFFGAEGAKWRNRSRTATSIGSVFSQHISFSEHFGIRLFNALNIPFLVSALMGELLCRLNWVTNSRSADSVKHVGPPLYLGAQRVLFLGVRFCGRIDLVFAVGI